MKRSALVAALLALGCALVALLCALHLMRSPSPASETPNVPPSETSSQASAPSQPSGDALTVLCPNLGKADGFLLLSGEGAVLIDTGENALPLLELMEQHSIKRLDALILSHYDKDHIGGSAAILNKVEVDRVFRTAFTEESEYYDALLSALSASEAEDTLVTDTLTLPLAGATFTLYPPLREHYDKDEDNNASLLAAVEYQGSSLLFAGDALKPRVTEFLEQQYDGRDFDFLKVPHHGRETKPTALLLEASTCPDALITSSAEEQESDKLLQKLEKRGTKAWLTREGPVTLTCQDGTIEITQ